MTILISGSLAFDRLAIYPGLFSDNFLEGKLSILNASFLVESVTRAHGGTAGNIAYNLRLLGERPLVISALGDDPDGREYLDRLTQWGLSLEAVHVDPGLPTPGAYIATDAANSQLIFFHPGAMAANSPFDPRGLQGDPESHVAMISPGGLSDMLRLSDAYREMGIPFVFDPGQQIPAFTGEELVSMLRGSAMLITNEYELDLLLGKCGLKTQDLFGLTGTVLTTLGDKGSRILTPSGDQRIAAVPVTNAVNPTGAGDSYRAGLLKGMTMGLDLAKGARLGSTVAAFCVETDGTQGHAFGMEALRERYSHTFREDAPF
jgi:adenosine kinase